jgi:thiamine pyrophosphate-dependent acetolactate synthase large subunit-like protein
MNRSRRLIGSFWHGSMANALAQGIGAQAAFPDRQIVSLSGDGGFTMLMGDYLSLVQLRLPVKVVVFNNGALGFIELEQKSTGFLTFATDLQNPDFAAMAEAVDIDGIRLEDPGEVDAGIAAALGHNGPVLVDAVVNRASFHYHGDGGGLHAVHSQSGDQRQGRRSHRPSPNKSLGARRLSECNRSGDCAGSKQDTCVDGDSRL